MDTSIQHFVFTILKPLLHGEGKMNSSIAIMCIVIIVIVIILQFAIINLSSLLYSTNALYKSYDDHTS